MKIYYLTAKDKPNWNRFVYQESNSTFYHLVEWKDIFEKSFSHQTFYLYTQRDSTITGILPIVYLKSIIFGKILCSMPFVNFGGIVSLDVASENLIISEAFKLQKRLNASFLELRHLKPSVQKLPSKQNKISMTIDLPSSADDIWKKFKGKHRTNIRKSLKAGFSLKRGRLSLLDDFYLLISKGWQHLGTPIYAKSFFRNILEILPKNTEIYVVYHNNHPVATAFNGKFKKTVEGMWTFALKEYSHLNVNYYLYWQMIKDASNEGMQNFHLGRSTKATNAVQFKSKWLAFPHQLYWEYIMDQNRPLPEINPMNSKYRLPINIWKNLPLTATQILGPHISKFIP